MPPVAPMSSVCGSPRVKVAGATAEFPVFSGVHYYPLESHVWQVLQVASLTHVHVCSLNLAIAALCTLFPLGFASEAHRAHLLPSLCPPMQRCHWAQTCSAHLALL